MRLYRKKPVVVGAVQWTGRPTREMNAFIGDRAVRMDGDGVTGNDPLLVSTLEGEEMICSPGDWLIQGVKGELYPCKPDIFEATYEEFPEVQG